METFATAGDATYRETRAKMSRCYSKSTTNLQHYAPTNEVIDIDIRMEHINGTKQWVHIGKVCAACRTTFCDRAKGIWRKSTGNGNVVMDIRAMLEINLKIKAGKDYVVYRNSN